MMPNNTPRFPAAPAGLPKSFALCPPLGLTVKCQLFTWSMVAMNDRFWPF